MNNLESWEAVIGLETHVQLNTKSKIFTSASTAFGDAPNTHIDPVVCGLPGTLPVLNETVLEYAVKTSLALNLNVAENCKFDEPLLEQGAGYLQHKFCFKPIYQPSDLSTLTGMFRHQLIQFNNFF